MIHRKGSAQQRKLPRTLRQRVSGIALQALSIHGIRSMASFGEDKISQNNKTHPQAEFFQGAPPRICVGRSACDSEEVRRERLNFGEVWIRWGRKEGLVVRG